MSKRSKERQNLTDELELTEYDINISRILKKTSKNKQKLKEAKRWRSKTYRQRKQGRFIFRRGTSSGDN